MNKQYRILLGDFGELGISGNLQKWNGEEYETMAFHDARTIVNFDKKYEELEEAIEDWSGDEFQNYAYAQILNLYIGYSVDDTEISPANTLIEDEFGNIYLLGKIKKIMKNGKKEYNNFFDSIIRDGRISKIEEWVNNNFSEIQNEKLGIDEYELTNAIKGNMDTNGTAWELINEEDIDSAIDTLKALLVADYRHNQTDYDSIDKSGMSDDRVKQLRREYNY